MTPYAMSPKRYHVPQSSGRGPPGADGVGLVVLVAQPFTVARAARRLAAKARYAGPRMRRAPIPFLGRWLGCIWLVCAALVLGGAPSAAAAPVCHAGSATSTLVGRPTGKVAWRAELLRRTAVYGEPSRVGLARPGWVGPTQASWLLVLDTSRRADGRCWVKVRLPTRPNDASGWLPADQVLLRPTVWSIAISRPARTLTVFRGGVLARRVSVVIGAPVTPTPTGLFSIIGAWRSPPDAFLGSWILALTAHSDALRAFDGGDGTIGIHGRGGASLLDPLGSADSHGCIRLSNTSIDWLVRSIGAAQLAGIPVRVH